jgi:hypothetical protein
MCVFKTPKAPGPQKIGAIDNSEAVRTADLEARLRRRRAGAGANVLTSPSGIPSTSTLGGVAQ